MRFGVGCALAITLVTGCAALAGLDEDFQVGSTGAAGAGTATASPTGTTTGGQGGATATGTGGTGTGTGTATGQGGQGGAVTGAPTGAGGQGGSGVVQCTGVHTYQAAVADCIEIPNPDPDACASRFGAGNMGISTSEYSLHTPHHAFLRFDLDPDVAQSALASVELRVTVDSSTYANSNDSGDVWRVDPFVRSDLFSGPPARALGSALAGSQGAVSQNELVTWSLPTNIVDGSSVYLELNPLTSDNTYYENNAGSAPPALVVTCP